MLGRARAALGQREREAQAKQTTFTQREVEWRAFAGTKGIGDLSPRAAFDLLHLAVTALGLIRQHRDISVRKRVASSSIDGTRELFVSIPELAAMADASPADVNAAADRFLEELEHRRTMQAAHESARREYEQATARAVEAQSALQTASESAETARREEASATASWATWLAERGFPADLLPATAREALVTVERCSASVQERHRLYEELAVAERSVHHYMEDLGELCDGIGRTRPDEAAAAGFVTALLEDLRQTREGALLRARAEVGRAGALTKVRAAEVAVLDRELEIAALLDAAAAKDEEEFRSRAAAYAERRAIGREIESAEATLRATTGHTDRDAIRAVFAELTPEAIDSEILLLTRTFSETNDELEALRRQRAESDARLRALQAADSIAQLRESEERLLERIRIAAREWSRYAIARYLLDEAKRKFEAEKQPAVIRDAARHFRTITGGRYENVIAPIGESTVEVVSASGERKAAELLSRGALEQLYLAIRFGYIENSKTGGETLPLVFDDILVNADPDRARACVRSILDLAQRNQVLYFTCHPATIDRFREADSSISVLSLKDGTFEWMGGAAEPAAAR